ncbi:MAG TPA: hypothetical protein VF551_05855, partial [Chthoniobacterales bacterium]
MAAAIACAFAALSHAATETRSGIDGVSGNDALLPGENGTRGGDGGAATADAGATIGNGDFANTASATGGKGGRGGNGAPGAGSINPGNG